MNITIIGTNEQQHKSKVMLKGKMTALERRAIVSLSLIMGLRMIGLFMVLPMFVLYAGQLKNATPMLIGLAMGVYGLSQAIFQIPFGMLSDKFGRKPIILIGLIIFAIGSLLAAYSHSITLLIFGRALQGIGAVGSTILALMADLTREEQRTKSMAIAGMTIGFSFLVAMMLGPGLQKWISASGLFFLAMVFALIAILILFTFVPTPAKEQWHRDTEPELSSFYKLLLAPELAKLNIGIFFLHALFTASFVVIPLSLKNDTHLAVNNQWLLYVPILLAAFIISFLCITRAESKHQIKPYFLSSILILALSEFLLWIGANSIWWVALGLGLFFTGFSLLEAFLPSLITRTAPAASKGSALGIYSCAQFLGIFIGGVLGGWLYGQFSFFGVYCFCILLALLWFMLATLMQPPRYLITQMLRLPSHLIHWDRILAKLRVIPGIVEVTFIAEEGIAYLKMDRGTIKHPDFIRIKEQLQYPKI